MKEYIKVCEEFLGYKPSINGEEYEYIARWDKLREYSKTKVEDVRAANVVLDELGIPHQRVFADNSQSDHNPEGEWEILWT